VGKTKGAGGVAGKGARPGEATATDVPNRVPNEVADDAGGQPVVDEADQPVVDEADRPDIDEADLAAADPDDHTAPDPEERTAADRDDHAVADAVEAPAVASAVNEERRGTISAELGVTADFDVEHEAQRRIDFLVDQLARTGGRGLVLGIDGGLDSTTAALLCRLAANQVRAKGGDAEFVTVRLPYFVESDEADALRTLDFVQPDEAITVNVGSAADELWGAVIVGGVGVAEGASVERVRGDLQARVRTVAHYAVAQARDLLVVGAGHATKAMAGSFTDYGACDVLPLAGLTSRRVRALAAHLGTPEALLGSDSTADVHGDRHRQPEGGAMGATHQEVDDYLEGHQVSAQVERSILAWHARTALQRTRPVAPPTEPTTRPDPVDAQGPSERPEAAPAH
jgi:NAD+ synthase